MGFASDGSQMLKRHLDALAALDGKKVEAGWFESDRYPDGKSVAVIARQNELGTVIDVPARTQTINRKISEKSGNFLKNGQFVKESSANFQTEHSVAAYQVVIPPRPFMRLAFANFMQKSAALQKSLAKKFFAGQITADQIMGQIGLALEGEIVKSIKNGGWQDNAASTIAKKGFNKPLIETAHMWQNVSSKVVSKE